MFNSIECFLEITGNDPERYVPFRCALYRYSQCEKAVTFGLGDVQSVESITVSWPGGKREVFRAPGIDQAIVLRQGSGNDEPQDSVDGDASLVE